MVVFLADALGYKHVGVDGVQRIRTQNIDQLARDGVRLTEGYLTIAFSKGICLTKLRNVVWLTSNLKL